MLNNSNATRTLAEQIEGMDHALEAKELAALLSVSPISIYKLARSKRIPHVRIGTSVRFCGRTVAQWLRSKEVN
jgi:excisionase family DNA binding protein